MLRAGLPTADTVVGDFKHQGGEDASFLETTVGESAFLDVSFASQQGLSSEQPAAPLQMRRRVRASFMTAIRESTLQSVLANAAQQEASSSSTAQCKADDLPANYARKSELRKRALGSIVSGLQEGHLQPALCSLCRGSQGPQEEEASPAPAAASTARVLHKEEPHQEAAAEASRKEELRRRLRQSLVAGINEGALARELVRASRGTGQQSSEHEEPAREAAAGASREEELRQHLRQSLVAGIAEGSLARELGRRPPGSPCGSRQRSAGEEMPVEEVTAGQSGSAGPLQEAAPDSKREKELRRHLRESLAAGVRDGALEKLLGSRAKSGSAAERGLRRSKQRERLADPDEDHAEDRVSTPLQWLEEGRSNDMRRRARQTLMSGIGDKGLERALGDTAERPPEPAQASPAAGEPEPVEQQAPPQSRSPEQGLQVRARETLAAAIRDQSLGRMISSAQPQSGEPSGPSQPQQRARQRVREAIASSVAAGRLEPALRSCQHPGGEDSDLQPGSAAASAVGDEEEPMAGEPQRVEDCVEEEMNCESWPEEAIQHIPEEEEWRQPVSREGSWSQPQEEAADGTAWSEIADEKEEGAAVEVEVLDGALYRALVAARKDSFSSSSSVLLQRPLPASREAPQHAHAWSRPRSAELQALRRQASRASSARSSSRMGPRGSRPGTQGSHRPTSASGMSSVALVPATPAQVVQPPTPDLRVHGLEEIQHAYNGLLLGDYERPQPSSTGCSSRRGRSPPTTVQQEASAIGRSSRPSSASHPQAGMHDGASVAAGHRHASPPGSGCEASAVEQPAEEAAGSARQEQAWSADKVEQDGEANLFASEQMDEMDLPEEPSHWRRGPEDEDALLSFEHLGGGPCNPEMERILNGGLFSALVAARCNSVVTSTGSTPRPMLQRDRRSFQAGAAVGRAADESEGWRTPEKAAAEVQPGTASTLDDHFRDTDGRLEATSPFSECSQIPAHEEDWNLQQDEAHADEPLGVHHGAHEEATASQPFELHAPGSSEAPEAVEAERMAQTWKSSADVEDKAHAEVSPITEKVSQWDEPAEEDEPAPAEVAEVDPSAGRNEMDDVNALPEDHAASLNQAASHLQDLFFVLKDVMLETPSASPRSRAHTPTEDSGGHEQEVSCSFFTLQDVPPPAPLVQREALPSRQEEAWVPPVQQQSEDAAPALAESTQRKEEPERPLQPAEPAALPAKQHRQEAAAPTPRTAAPASVASAQRQRPVEELEQLPVQPQRQDVGTAEEVAVPTPRNQAPAVLEQREEAGSSWEVQADVLGPADDSLQPGGPNTPAAQHAALAKAAEDLERMALFLRKANTSSTLCDAEPRTPPEARSWAPVAGSQRQPERQSLGEWPPTGQTQALQRRDQLRQRLRRSVASAIAAGQLHQALGVPPAAEERQPAAEQQAAEQQERQPVAKQQAERQHARRPEEPSPASRSMEEAALPPSKFQRPALQRSGQKALQQPTVGAECRRRVAATLAAAISSSRLQQVLGSGQTAAAPVQGASPQQPQRKPVQPQQPQQRPVQPQQPRTEAEPAQAPEQQQKPQVPLEQQDPPQLQPSVQRQASRPDSREASNATAVHAALGLAAAQLEEMANIFRQVSDGASPRSAPGISQTGVPVAEAAAEEVPKPAAAAGNRPPSEEQTAPAHGGRRLQRVKGEKPQQQAVLKRPSRPDAGGCPSPKSPGLFLPAAKPRSGSRLEQLRARVRQTLARGVQEGLLQPSLQKSAEPGARAKPGKDPPQSAPGGACGRARELFKAAVREGYLQSTLEKVALQHERIDQVRRDRERYRQRADAARKAEARKKNAAIVDGGIGGPCDGTPRILKSACMGRSPVLGLDGANVGSQALAVLARAIWDGQLQPPLGSSSLVFHPDDLLCNVGWADKQPSLKLVQRDVDGCRSPLSVRSEMSRVPSEATSGGKTVRWQDEEVGTATPREAAAHSAATRMEVKRTPRRSSYGYPAEPEPPPDASHGSQTSESSDLRQKARGKASLGESSRRPASQGHLHLLAENNQAACRRPQSGLLRRSATLNSGSPSPLLPTRHVSFWVTKGQEVIRSTPSHGHRKEPTSPWSEAGDQVMPFLRRFQRSASCSALTSPFGPKQVLPGAMPEDSSPQSRQPFVPASPAGAAVHAVRWLQPSAKEPGPVSPSASSKSSAPVPPEGGPPW